MRFHTLIKGGRLVDPAQGIDDVFDVGFHDGKVAAVGDDLPAGEALDTIDADGRLVTPGMIDLHVHVFEGVTHYESISLIRLSLESVPYAGPDKDAR